MLKCYVNVAKSSKPRNKISKKKKQWGNEKSTNVGCVILFNSLGFHFYYQHIQYMCMEHIYGLWWTVWFIFGLIAMTKTGYKFLNSVCSYVYFPDASLDFALNSYIWSYYPWV